MEDEWKTRRGMWRWGIPASILVHAVIAFMVFVGLPVTLPKPEAEQSVSVEIVPPPEQPQPEAPPAEAEQKPAQTLPPEEEAKAESPAAPPPEKAEEQAPPPPEQAQAEAEKPPEPLPPQASEMPAPNPPTPEPEPPPPEQQPAEQPPADQAPQAAERGEPLPALRPVFQFGEKDAGPEKAADGNAAQTGEAIETPAEEQPQQADDQQSTDEAQQADAQQSTDTAQQAEKPGDEAAAGAEKPPAEENQPSRPTDSASDEAAAGGMSDNGQADAAPGADAADNPQTAEPSLAVDATGDPVPELALPEVGLGAATPANSGDAAPPEGKGEAAGAAPDGTVNAEIAGTQPTSDADGPTPAGTPDGSKAGEAKSGGGKPGAAKPAGLKQAKRLFSANATDDALATTAIGSIPRDMRVAQLCSSELREQLRHNSPAYSPDIVPGPRLKSGTVLDVRSVGFRANAQWYDVSFRCEVDPDVTKVVSFALQVGGAVPRAQWRKRGFPEF